MATAFLAAFWPMMKRSSSETISRGVSAVMWSALGLDGLERQLVIGEDADFGRDRHRPPRDLLGRQTLEIDQRPGGGQRVGSARADPDEAALGFQDITRAG